MRWDFGSSSGNFGGARRAAVSCIASRLRRGLQAGRLQPVVDMQGGLTCHTRFRRSSRGVPGGVFAAASLKRWASASRSSKKGLFVLDAFPSPATIIGRRWLRVSCSRRTNHRQPAGAPCHGAGRNTFAEHLAPSIVTCLRHCSVGLPRWNGS